MDANLIAGLGGIALTGVVTYIVARGNKQFDARAQAEAALIGIGPQIIREQNTRIDALYKQCSDCWERERECREELGKQMTQLGAALLRITALEQRDGP